MYVSPWSLEARLKYIVSSQNVLDKIQLYKVKNQRNLLRKLAYFKKWTQLSDFLFHENNTPLWYVFIVYVGKICSYVLNWDKYVILMFLLIAWSFFFNWLI